MLYDVSSAAFEGRSCPLGAIGYARDGVKGRRQIVYGLLCTTAGVPVAIEVFDGNTADPKTLTAQIRKLTTRFGLSRVALVGDRGMLTSARITEELRPAYWIGSARCAPTRSRPWWPPTRCSCRCSTSRTWWPSPTRTTPGERLIGCLNPALAAERTRKRGELLRPTQTELDKITAATRRERQPLRGKDIIELGLGRLIRPFQMAKHFTITITEDSFTFCRNEDTITAEAALDGIYVRHQPARRHPHRRQCGAALQGTRRRRAVLPHPQQRTRLPAHPPPPRRSGARPHVPADAVRLHQLAHETGPGRNPVLRQRQTRRSRQTRRPRRRGRTLRPSAHQSRAQTHPRRRRGTQLHQPARRPGHHRANHIQPADDTRHSP